MPEQSYIICTAPRSGSTLLCTLLRATGVAGWPESYFHGPEQARWAKALGLPPDAPMPEIVAQAKRKGCNGGQVFGLRQQWHSFPLLRQVLEDTRPEATDRDRFEAALGPLRYVFLHRPSKLDQALSYIRAEQTGLWHRNADGSVYEARPAQGHEAYDSAAITAQIAAFQAADAGWRAWFAKQQIQPLELCYTALAADPARVLAQVLEFIGLDPEAARGIKAPTRKLADQVSVDWAARYRAETGYHEGG